MIIINYNHSILSYKIMSPSNLVSFLQRRLVRDIASPVRGLELFPKIKSLWATLKGRINGRLEKSNVGNELKILWINMDITIY